MIKSTLSLTAGDAVAEFRGRHIVFNGRQPLLVNSRAHLCCHGVHLCCHGARLVAKAADACVPVYTAHRCRNTHNKLLQKTSSSRPNCCCLLANNCENTDCWQVWAWLPFPWEIQPPPHTRFLGPPQSTPKMASRLAQPFLYGSRLYLTDRKTHRKTMLQKCYSTRNFHMHTFLTH